MEEFDYIKYIDFWLESSQTDSTAMENLYHSGDFSWSLFLGHLVLEKLLKARITKITKSHPPFTHDLTRLAELSGINFSDEQLDWLDTITTFNISAGYESHKRTFYNKCTREYSEEWFNKIKQLQVWIKTKLYY